jgi:molybdenum cofactor cytidylyltransferase
VTIVREEWVAAVILAAGGASRYGSPKQLLENKGETLVHRAARAALDAGANPIFVVVGASAKFVNASVENIPDVRCLPNPKWESGLASSLAVGMRAVLKTACQGAIVTLADQPFVDGTALASIIEAFDDDHRLIASAYNSTIGVPALFGREFFEELTHLEGDAGAGGWLRARRDAVTAIPLERAALDIDSPSDSALLT